MTHNQQLLADYVRTGSEAAFRELLLALNVDDEGFGVGGADSGLN